MKQNYDARFSTGEILILERRSEMLPGYSHGLLYLVVLVHSVMYIEDGITSSIHYSTTLTPHPIANRFYVIRDRQHNTLRNTTRKPPELLARATSRTAMEHDNYPYQVHMLILWAIDCVDHYVVIVLSSASKISVPAYEKCYAIVSYALTGW